MSKNQMDEIRRALGLDLAAAARMGSAGSERLPITAPVPSQQQQASNKSTQAKG